MKSSVKNNPSAEPAKILFVLAALVIVIGAMRLAADLVVPFLFSLFMAIILVHPISLLQERGVSRMVALPLVLVSAILLLSLVSILVGASISEFSDSLPQFEKKINNLITELYTWLDGFGFNFRKGDLLHSIDPGASLSIAHTMLHGLSKMFANFILIIFTIVFILIELPSASSATTLARHSGAIEAAIKVQKYMSIKAATSLITGLAITAWLFIIDVPYPVLWGVLAFLLNFIPNIGSILAAIPAVLIAMLDVGSSTALLAVAGYVVVNLLVGNVLEPRMMGKDLGLRMLFVFLSMVFWGWVFGPLGMLLAVPLTVSMQILLEGYEQTKPIAEFLRPTDSQT